MLGYPVPLAMATQHPDSASRGFTAQDEIEEALRDLLPPSRGGLGLDEKMVDYEGKLTPYHQVSWIVEEALKHGLTPGEDFLITPRIPSERLEEPERQMMVLWGVIVANKKAIVKAGQEAVRYIINPMSSTGYEVYLLQRRIVKLQRLAEEELGIKTGRIEVIPLVEDYESLLHVEKILEGARNALLNHMGLHYSSYRVLLGKSDTALAYGHLTSSLALVYGISRLYAWAEKENTRVYPIIGVGALPFRGHLAPHSVELFREQYSGYSTVTIQSGLRYDQGPGAVERVVSGLIDGLHSKPPRIGLDELKLITAASRIFTREYLRVILRVINTLVDVSRFVPRHRARLSAGEYPRSLESSIVFTHDPELIKVKPPRTLHIPRAITFAASLYTMGVPPALIGTGRGLREASRILGEESVELLVRKLLPLLPVDIEFELQFYAPTIMREYIRDEKTIELIREDVEVAKSYARKVREPHPEYVSALLKALEAVRMGVKGEAEKAIAIAGKMRGSLG
ncbi:MAG: phosphoenolpyruvate carboxylase [Hyperthermus sp.]|nr:MAG: phosphoenolpyruvate carboxylase [Hyperthermus sp.]